MSEKADIGIVGLGVMGQNLALNINDKGFKVSGYDSNLEKALQLVEERAKVKGIQIATSLKGLVDSLKAPRKVLLMVPAGNPVDAVLQELTPLLEPNDIVIDGGNSFFKDTERRAAQAEAAGLLYVGAGVSGGEEGALRGPSIMPGGSAEARPQIEPILKAIAAKAEDGEPCCAWIGKGGAGHFVKMVHNGIEYADMQLIGEAYFLMERVLGMTESEMAAVFDEWDRGDLQSYLVEITRDVLREPDPETGEPLVRKIKDTAEQKGTGKWTSQTALDLGVPAPTVAEAVFARCLSAARVERLKASELYRAPAAPPVPREAFVGQIGQALLASKICAYAQGFRLMREASQEFGWGLDFAAIASIWRAGCIVRARILEPIRRAFLENPELENLLLAPGFAGLLQDAQEGWRSVVSVSALAGVPAPALASALAYFDGYRSARLPANLLQAQRDYFGAHTFERLDREGKFHHPWGSRP